MDLDERFSRLSELFAKRGEIEAEIRTLIGEPKEAVEKPAKRRPVKIKKEKRKYAKCKAKVETLDSPIGQRSDCCGKPIVTSGGDEGTYCYVCTACSEACDIETEASLAKKAEKAKGGIKLECCGARSNRHKNNCPKAHGFHADMKTEEDPKTKGFNCDECGRRFVAAADSDGKCPECGSDNIWPDKTA